VCDHGGARGRKRERFVRVPELLEPAPAELLARAPEQRGVGGADLDDAAVLEVEDRRGDV